MENDIKKGIMDLLIYKEILPLKTVARIFRTVTRNEITIAALFMYV